MREIKFRGKRIDNGEFVYGNLIGTDVIVGNLVEFNDEYFNTEFWYKVDAETIGQFTGLKDRNGKDVYEGDIIRVTSHGDIYTDIVKWSKAKCSFIFSDESNVEYYCADEYKQENSEVIGNIYENEELVSA